MLHDEGQSFWLDDLTRELLTSGALARSIDRRALTGAATDVEKVLQAIRRGAYDEGIRSKAEQGMSREEASCELLLEDAVWAADLLRPVWNRTSGMDGWVSSPLSPALFQHAGPMLAAASELQQRARRPNLLVEIPGTAEGLIAAEGAIAAGISVNVTLLFSPEQYGDAADAYLRGLERRLQAGLELQVGSFASMSLACWKATGRDVGPLRNRVGFAIAKETYRQFRALLRSPRWQRLFSAGARPQRLVWASAGDADELLPVRALYAPFTVSTMGVRALHALTAACNSAVVAPPPAVEDALARMAAAGIDLERLARRIQAKVADSAFRSWRAVFDAIALKTTVVAKAG